MKILPYTVALLLVCSVWTNSSFAQTSDQTIEQLQSEIDKAQREIQLSQQLLSANKNQQKSSLTSLQLVQSNIRNRKKIVSNLDNQLRLINNDIKGNNSRISQLSSNLKTLKKDYSSAVVNNYKDIKQNNFLLFIFSSESFYDMQLRSKYLERLASMSREKRDEIEATQAEITRKNYDLKNKQEQTERILTERNSEIKTLAKDESEGKKILSSLKSQEKNISSDIQKNSSTIAKLQKTIQDIIEQEAMRKEGVSEEIKKLDIKLSNVFSENKGKFPPPIRGVITLPFGLQSDPMQSKVKVKNNGVDITTSETTVRSIFEGEVVKVFFFQGVNNSVMIRHGHYYTVYTNLVKLRVKQGDYVDSGEMIGSLDKSNRENTSHFELWHEKSPQNPEVWINF
ncbi:MAG: peptidoglycan DD-metalloendopeptidase family protein [Rikenellaceae bacterium]